MRVCLKTHFKDIEGNIWKQIDGIPIRKLISGTIAGIFMGDYEPKYITNNKELTLNWKPKLWKRQKI